MAQRRRYDIVVVNEEIGRTVRQIVGELRRRRIV
jgi:hypothetical protein